MNILLSRYSRANTHFYRKIFQEAVLFTGPIVKNGELYSREKYSKHLFQPISFFGSTSVKDAPISEKIKHNLSVFKNLDLNQLRCAPVPAQLYGFGGLIPFVFPPLYFIVSSYSPFLATAQLCYGATILAFVGGVKWGNALAKEDISHEQIGISTVPSLVAWVSLLVPEPIGYLMLSSGLLGALYVDLVSSKYPPWFSAMRFTLTSVATISLVITFLFNVFH